MRNLAIVGCLVIGILSVLSVSGNAQVSSQYAVHVPFDFSVHKTLFKAGDYTVGPANGISNLRALVLRSRSSAKGELLGPVIIGSYESEAKGTVTFVKDSDGWALWAIDTPGFALKLKNTGRGEILSASANKTRETQTIMLRN